MRWLPTLRERRIPKAFALRAILRLLTWLICARWPPVQEIPAAASTATMARAQDWLEVGPISTPLPITCSRMAVLFRRWWLILAERIQSSTPRPPLRLLETPLEIHWSPG